MHRKQSCLVYLKQLVFHNNIISKLSKQSCISKWNVIFPPQLLVEKPWALSTSLGTGLGQGRAETLACGRGQHQPWWEATLGRLRPSKQSLGIWGVGNPLFLTLFQHFCKPRSYFMSSLCPCSLWCSCCRERTQLVWNFCYHQQDVSGKT